MKVLHVVGDLGHGGIQNYVAELTKYQNSNRNINVAVVVLYSKGALWDKVSLNVDDILFLDIKSARDIIGLLKLYRYIKSSEVDVVHVHVIHPVMGVFLKLLDIPAVYTEHGGGLLAGRKANRIIYKYFHKFFCRFIAISNLTKSTILSVNKSIADKVEVISNGIDLDKVNEQNRLDVLDYAPKLAGCKYIVGIIARLVEQKGVDLFIHTASIICHKRDDIGFVIVGDGPQRDQLEDRIVDFDINDNIQLLGFRSDQISILKSWDAYLFTSVQEAFGLVIIESMASGVPVVAAKQKTAVAEIIENNIDGLYIENGSADLLAERLEFLLDNSLLSENIASHAKDKVKNNFNMSKNERQVYRLYESCVH